MAINLTKGQKINLEKKDSLTSGDYLTDGLDNTRRKKKWTQY